MLDEREVPSTEAAQAPQTLSDAGEVARLTETLVSRAWRRHGIRRGTAEDIAQAAFIAFWRCHTRYPVAAEHPAILSGIFRNLCLHHVRTAARERRRLERYCADPDTARENPWIRAERPKGPRGVLEELAARDAQREIVRAIEHLTPDARRIAELITEDGMSRRGLIAYYGVNPNTLDSRLRACRLELRRLLRGNELAG